MTIDLEHELSAAMRAEVAGLRPSRDVLAAARRAHRRRGTALKATSAVGVLSLGGVAVAFSLPGLTSAVPVKPAPATLHVQSVAYVSGRVRAALADETGKVQHLSLRYLQNGTPQGGTESWFDVPTGSQRHLTRAAGGGLSTDFSAVQRGGRSVDTTVDYATRTWYADSYRQRPGSPPGGLLTSSPAQLKAELERGEWTLVGPGGDILQLRKLYPIEGRGQAGLELWVDSSTFQVVKLAAWKPEPKGDFRTEADIQWLPRTAANLAKLNAAPPAGFRQVERPADPPKLVPGRG